MMYTATMNYEFKEECFDQACGIWKDLVITSAQIHPGFVRMQFLSAKPKAMAIGTWESDEFAHKFMETGVFKKLMEKLESMVEEKPVPHKWELLYFAEKQQQG